MAFIIFFFFHKKKIANGHSRNDEKLSVSFPLFFPLIKRLYRILSFYKSLRTYVLFTSQGATFVVLQANRRGFYLNMLSDFKSITIYSDSQLV